MKTIPIMLFTFFILVANAQDVLVPNKNAFEKKWIKDQSYKMQWFAIRETSKILIGEVTTKTVKGKKTLTIVTAVEMKNSKTPWLDSTVASTTDLSPIRHASYNAQRDMALDFGKTVTGFYNDKIKGTKTKVVDTPNGTYFDSNLYPMLISWLPLKDGLRQEILIYDYNPSGKTGIIKAWVKDVTGSNYTTIKSGKIPVWIVKVADEISSGQTLMTYYIAKSDRKLWKQEINAGGRKMVMQRIEQ